MNPVQSPHGSLVETFGELAVAATKNIRHASDHAQDSCTEETIAEDLSDTSQNTLDGIVTNIAPLSMQHLTPLMIPNMHSDISSIMAQNLSPCTGLQHSQDRVAPFVRSEIEGEHRKKDRHKKRSKNWTTLETLKLIKARSELDEKFQRSSRKGVLWDEIAQALRKADVGRDGQQCKDKWEKLMAGYKEVRDGNRDKDDLPFYEDIHYLLSGKRGNNTIGNYVEDGIEMKGGNGHSMGIPHVMHDAGNVRETTQEETSLRKRKRETEYGPLADMSIVQELLETVLSTQERLFRDVLDAVEKKERIREQIRQEREDIWRAEERAQRFAFNNTMVILTQKLLGEMPPPGGREPVVSPAPPTALQPINSSPNDLGSLKKRSKNWKKTEVMHLIRYRKEMESKFAQSTRRAGLWDELGLKLATLGIKRDGKQCREKWDKLMAGYKDVIDGRRDREESPYFVELSIYMEMIKEKDSIPSEASKDECIEI